MDNLWDNPCMAARGVSPQWCGGMPRDSWRTAMKRPDMLLGGMDDRSAMRIAQGMAARSGCPVGIINLPQHSRLLFVLDSLESRAAVFDSIVCPNVDADH